MMTAVSQPCRCRRVHPTTVFLLPVPCGIFRGKGNKHVEAARLCFGRCPCDGMAEALLASTLIGNSWGVYCEILGCTGRHKDDKHMLDRCAGPGAPANGCSRSAWWVCRWRGGRMSVHSLQLVGLPKSALGVGANEWGVVYIISIGPV